MFVAPQLFVYQTEKKTLPIIGFPATAIFAGFELITLTTLENLQRTSDARCQKYF